MRTRAKFVKEIFDISLKGIRRIDVKFDPFHPNAGSVREFYQGVTVKRHLKKNPEIVTRAQVVSDKSDPLVTVQFIDNHKLILNCKHLESNHIVNLIKQFESEHKDEREDV